MNSRWYRRTLSRVFLVARMRGEKSNSGPRIDPNTDNLSWIDEPSAILSTSQVTDPLGFSAEPGRPQSPERSAKSFQPPKVIIILDVHHSEIL